MSNGIVNDMARKLPAALAERIRFPEKRNQCWRWIGATKNTGMRVEHGYVYYEGRRITARKAVYTHLRGEPDGPLSSSCGLDDCVNPWHQVTDRRVLVVSGKPHGDASTYGNHGCRCRPCKDARAASAREYAARRANSS